MIVKLGRKKYKVYITSMIRPQQDFETEYQDAGNYYLELSMVIVKDVTVTLMGDIAGGISFEVNEALNKRKTSAVVFLRMRNPRRDWTNESEGVDFSELNKQLQSSRPSSEGGVGTSNVYKYSDSKGTRFIIHEVTDSSGNIIHRDFDAVRIPSGQLILKE